MKPKKYPKQLKNQDNQSHQIYDRFNPQRL
jgi:hypothetical protein